MNVEPPEFDFRDPDHPSRIGDDADPDWPFEDMDAVQYGILRYTTVLLFLLDRINGTLLRAYEAIRMGLAGRLYKEHADPDLMNDYFKELRIDPLIDQQDSHPQERDLHMTGDFDSFIAFSPTLGLQRPIHVSPFPNYSKTLKKDNHLRITIDNHLVPAYQIPNFCLGSWEHHGQINVLLPNMWQHVGEGASRKIPVDIQERIYNHCIYPALKEVNPEHVTHLHNTYKQAISNQRDKRSTLHQTSTSIPADMVDFFGQQFAFLAKHSGERAIEDVIFMVELRGTKSLFTWRHGHPEERAEAFDLLSDLFLPGWLEQRALAFVDVATEVYMPGHCLRVKTESHPDILQWLMPDLSQRHAQEAAQLPTFLQDPIAQIYSLSGFRWQPNAGTDRYDGIKYIQVYFTDKTISYAVGFANIWSQREITTMMPGNITKLSDELAKLCNAVVSLKENPGTDADDREERQDGAIRIEARVPWRQAQTTMEALPFETAEPWIVAYRSARWWTFIWARLRVLKLLVDMMASAKRSLLGEDGALQLAAAVIVMLNSLFSRESSKRQYADLLEASGHRVPIPDNAHAPVFENETSYIGHELGLYFLSDVVLDGNPDVRVPRLPQASVRTLGAHRIPRLFGYENAATLRMAYGVDGIDDPREWRPNPNRTRNRVRGRAGHDVTQGLRPFGDLPRVGITVPATVVFTTPTRIQRAEPGFNAARPIHDNEGEKDLGDLSVNPEEVTPTEFLEAIIAQMVVDVILCAANQKEGSEPCHMLIPPMLRTHVTIEMFQSFDIRGILAKAQVRFADAKLWKLTLNHVFPDPAKWPKKTLQNYPDCRWWRQWRYVSQNQLSSTHATIMRERLLLAMHSLKWIPAFASDRIWDTRSGGHRSKLANRVVYPAEAEMPAVILMINPAYVHLARRSAEEGGLQFGADLTDRDRERLEFLQGVDADPDNE